MGTEEEVENDFCGKNSTHTQNTSRQIKVQKLCTMIYQTGDLFKWCIVWLLMINNDQEGNAIDNLKLLWLLRSNFDIIAKKSHFILTLEANFIPTSK